MDWRYVCVFMIGLFFYGYAFEDVDFVFDYCQNKITTQTAFGKSEQDSEQMIFECLNDGINRFPSNQRQNLLSNLPFHAGFLNAVEKCLNSQLPTPLCDPNTKYRTLDGSCNNLQNPTWGETGDCVQRILPIYYEGTHDLRQSVKGGPLPPPRDLSAKLCSGQPQPSPVSSFLFPVFGQFVAHEMSSSTPSDHPKCCPFFPKNDPRCNPMLVKPDDPFYGKFNVTCLNQSRTDPCNKCTLGKRQQANRVTPCLDGSNVYGTTIENMVKLRKWDGTGRLITDSDLLPSNDDPKKMFCPKDQKNKCFSAGDGRVNQHSGLMSMHTLFMREHNRIVSKLKLLNPFWKEEQLFNEGRKPGADYGGDLASIDISRGRDHGLPPYIKILEYSSKNQLTVNSFDDLNVVMSSQNIQLLKDSYEDVRDIDPWIGMIMEENTSGSLIGSTASCVIGKQFHSIKFGDRFFFEHVGEIPSFTANQRETLKNSSLSRLLCDNTEIAQVQLKSLLLPGQDNPVISCELIPEVNLSLWKE